MSDRAAYCGFSVRCGLSGVQGVGGGGSAPSGFRSFGEETPLGDRALPLRARPFGPPVTGPAMASRALRAAAARGDSLRTRAPRELELAFGLALALSFEAWPLAMDREYIFDGCPGRTIMATHLLFVKCCLLGAWSGGFKSVILLNCLSRLQRNKVEDGKCLHRCSEP